MPRQKRTIQVESPDVQGEGSWVKLSKLTWGEIKAMRQRAQEVGDNADLQFEMGEDTIRRHVVSWNWADEEGNPLPQPTEDPQIFDSLTDDEFNFLAEVVAGSEESRKN